jgi:serine/threonine protein kinase
MDLTTKLIAFLLLLGFGFLLVYFTTRIVVSIVLALVTVVLYYKMEIIKKSFNGIFTYYFRKTYGLSELSFEYDNGFYEKQFKQDGEYIDRGSYGTVYRAQKKEMDKGFYAIKKIKPVENDQKAIMLKEVRVLFKLDSNYIVRYYHSWFEQNREEIGPIICSLFIQMELCDGNLEDFNEKIINVSANISSIDRNSILTPAYYLIYCRVFNELIECVDYLHKQEIIHRDLRPANILLSRFPYERFIKIGDFGYATRHKSDEKGHTKIEADIKYVAPEIENGEKHNEKADIYSLGKMMRLFFRIENYK